jgi:N-acetylglutamate synthase-like GNAT family acetyltransferase
LITYRRIETSDPEYAKEKDLRDRILRRPLDRVLSEEDTNGEDHQVHLIAHDEDGRLIGCVLLKPGGDGSARIRQMAVDESLQGRGIGRELMLRMEEIARTQDIRKIVLHARLTAEGFYAKLGYRAVPGTFREVGVSHCLMEKGLAPEGESPPGTQSQTMEGR